MKETWEKIAKKEEVKIMEVMENQNTVQTEAQTEPVNQTQENTQADNAAENAALLERIKQLESENQKLQGKYNTASKEAADNKKAYKDKLNEQERRELEFEEKEEARKQADAERDSKIAEYELKFRQMDYSKRYMGMGMDEKTAETMASLTGVLENPDKYFSELDKYIKNAVKTESESALQDFLKSRPDIKAGSGDASEDTLAMQKAKELNGIRNGGVNTDALKNFM